MRNDFLKEALAIVGDPDVLVSLAAGRVRMLRRGNRPLVAVPETLSFVDVALREIIEGRIEYFQDGIVVRGDNGA